jgi:serine-type D-Ala-D-Ala carboxypeptidase (penicillin-binding protein 5/6)
VDPGLRTAIAAVAAAMAIAAGPAEADLVQPDQLQRGVSGVQVARAKKAVASERRATRAATRGAALAASNYDAVAPRAAIVFDVATGKPLWQLNPGQPMPIASLTKMMTALLIAERHAPGEQLPISRKAAKVPGSRIGVLPAGKRVPLGPVFVGMLLVSGNDAAEALAEYDAGSEAAFVRRMNRRAKTLGMTCTHYSSPHGLQDKGNYSCARDLATLAEADLANPWIRDTVALRKAKFPFPIDGGKLDVANNDYFVQRGLRQIPGAVVTGLKTGYTAPAGRCYVVTAELGGRELGVVLLHSPDPLHQVPMLLARAFAGL